MKTYINDSIAVKQRILDDDAFLETLEQARRALDTCFASGNKVLIAGNGGSAADAQHFATEIVGRFMRERRGYPAIALTTDTSIITAWSNDYSFTSLYARQLEALGAAGDVFVAISTSGNSENIIQAAQQARSMGLTVIGLLGRDGGRMNALCDISLVVPSESTPRIQESHIMLIHILCEEAEKQFE